MPIRIRCRDKWPHEQQLTEMEEIAVYFSEVSLACYSDRKSNISAVDADATEYY